MNPEQIQALLLEEFDHYHKIIMRKYAKKITHAFEWTSDSLIQDINNRAKLKPDAYHVTDEKNITKHFLYNLFFSRAISVSILALYDDPLAEGIEEAIDLQAERIKDAAKQFIYSARDMKKKKEETQKEMDNG